MTALPMSPDMPAVPSASFEQFHRRYSGEALRYARAILGPDSAEDACQEAWLRAWRAWGVADPSKLERWLRAIVRNCCFDVQRRGHIRDRAAEFFTDPGAAPDDVALAVLELDTLWAGLERLSPALRETLWLREVLAMPYAEIARSQHIPLGTVMSRLHAARGHARRLRSAVAE